MEIKKKQRFPFLQIASFFNRPDAIIPEQNHEGDRHNGLQFLLLDVSSYKPGVVALPMLCSKIRRKRLKFYGE